MGAIDGDDTVGRALFSFRMRENVVLHEIFVAAAHEKQRERS